MDSCKIIHILSVIAYGFIFYSGASWIIPEEESFTWPRFLFLTAVLLLMEKYELVPKPLTCPPFYMFYKVVAAVIVANIALLTVWFQMEDFLKWLLSSFAALFEYVPMVNRKLAFGEDPNYIFALQMLVSVYFLVWVLMSSGYIPRLKGNSDSCTGTGRSAPLTPQTPSRRRRRVRC